MTEIHLTDRAMMDLEDIYDRSLHRWGEPTADRYLSSIEQALNLLQTQPQLLAKKEHISTRFFAYPAGKHWLLCDVFEEKIFVLTIAHMSLNLMDRLQQLEPTLDREVGILQDRFEQGRS